MLLDYHKEANSPIWDFFTKSPESFNEVKGEWSLAKITTLIQSKNIHMNIDKSSEHYSFFQILINYKEIMMKKIFGSLDIIKEPPGQQNQMK
jgi:hypothetical protein